MPAVALALFLATMPAAATTTAQPPTPATATIRSPRALERYLHGLDMDASPLGALSPGARKRFLAGLVFGPHGLGSFPLDDLKSELTHPQIVKLLSLFGVEAFADGMGLSPAEYRRRRRERRFAARTRGCDPKTCSETPVEQDFDKLLMWKSDASLPATQLAVAISHRYDRLFTRHQTRDALIEASAPDLRLIKRAAEHVIFHVPNATHIAQLRADLTEMDRRGIATDTSYMALYQALVRTRHFRQARVLAQRHPSLPVSPLPTFHEPATLPPGQPTALSLRSDGRSMTRRTFDLTTSTRIVVVASCHFSRDAARAIAADPKLKSLFSEHAVWLADPREQLDDVRQWNNEFPGQPIHVAWNKHEWSMLDDWAMPTFYVFRHGKLVDRWSGFPPDTGMRTLRRHLRDDGVW